MGSSKGNSGLVVWEDPPDIALFLVEAVYILESVAPAQLHIERFLPPTPVRVCVDPSGDFSGLLASDWIGSRDEASFRIQQDPELLRGLLPPLEKAREHARKARESLLMDSLVCSRFARVRGGTT